jgi:hypothetical protein
VKNLELSPDGNWLSVVIDHQEIARFHVEYVKRMLKPPPAPKFTYEEVHVCIECDADEPVDRVRAGDESLDVCPCCTTIEPSTRVLYQLSTGELVDDETLDALEAEAAANATATANLVRGP